MAKAQLELKSGKIQLVDPCNHQKMSDSQGFIILSFETPRRYLTWQCFISWPTCNVLHLLMSTPENIMIRFLRDKWKWTLLQSSTVGKSWISQPIESFHLEQLPGLEPSLLLYLARDLAAAQYKGAAMPRSRRTTVIHNCSSPQAQDRDQMPADHIFKELLQGQG